MELEVLQENLNRGLNTVARVLASRPQVAILSNILLRTETGQLQITASNLETTIMTSIGAKIEAAGEYTVPGRTFLELVAGLPAEKLTISQKDGVLTLSGGKFKGKIAGTPATEFPKLVPEEKTKAQWKIDKKAFQEGVSKVAFAAGQDESRAVLTGVLFSSDEVGLTLAATDGFRLSVNKIPAEGGQKETKFIIPAKTLAEVNRLLGEEKGENEKAFLMIYLPEINQVAFDLGEIKIYSRLIAGNFPDYEKIIPANSTIQVTAATEEFSKAIKLASIFARDSANIVKLKIDKGKLKISANAPEVGENESEIDITVKKGADEEFVVAFNYRYLLDLFVAVGSTELIIDFNGPLTAGVFRLPKDDNFLHIIMPVRVQG
ncbi:DNA polymerase III subunit beta [Patescibacteria group bacterium]|nr:DNA polymerase III subunit beta [Patescibacteria group bacterium]